MSVKGFLKLLFLKIKLKKKKVKLSSCQVGINSSFGGYNKIGANTLFDGRIGLCSYIGSNCVIGGTIGSFCSISDYVHVAVGNHPSKKFVSTSPSFYSNLCQQNGISFVKENRFEEIKYADTNSYICVGNDVWIGQDVIILSGISIGDGAIIAAGAVVTKNVEAYEIVGGVPARHIRYRFNSDEINYLLKLQWWNKDLNWITRHASLFSDISLLMKEVHLDD